MLETGVACTKLIILFLYFCDFSFPSCLMCSLQLCYTRTYATYKVFPYFLDNKNSERAFAHPHSLVFYPFSVRQLLLQTGQRYVTTSVWDPLKFNGIFFPSFLDPFIPFVFLPVPLYSFLVTQYPFLPNSTKNNNTISAVIFTYFWNLPNGSVFCKINVAI